MGSSQLAMVLPMRRVHSSQLPRSLTGRMVSAQKMQSNGRAGMHLQLLLDRNSFLPSKYTFRMHTHACISHHAGGLMFSFYTYRLMSLI